MANRPFAPMPIAQRAKQFMPFSALGGLDEALREKELELTRVQKTELSEERRDTILRRVGKLEKGMRVVCVWFERGQLLRADGTVDGVFPERGAIRVDMREIPVPDITSLRIL